MSGGKSAVVAFGIEDHETDQLWAVEVELRGAKMRSDEYGDRIVPLVPESLLLDARADLDKVAPMIVRLTTEALDAKNRAIRAEAMAGERLALLAEIRKDGLGRLRKDTIRKIDTAIDAVGGRGE